MNYQHHIPATPNTRDPLAVYEDKDQAMRDALAIYAPLARKKGYRVKVRETCTRPGRLYGIYLVAVNRRRP